MTTLKKVYTVINEVIELNPVPLAASGGEGAVFLIVNSNEYPNHCVKIYKDEILKKPEKIDLKRKKVQYLISHRPPNYLHEDHFMFCWPIQTIHDLSGNFIGFIMPLAFTESEKLYELSTLNMHRRFDQHWKKWDRSSTIGFKARLGICNRVAFAVYCLHKWEKFIIADLKPQNILINREGKISITDIDSFQIYSAKEIKYQGDAATPEYLPAEYHLPGEANQIPTINWDKFAMAVSFYQILFGIHPYSATAKDILKISMIHENITNDLFVHGVNKVHLKIVPLPHEKYHSLPKSMQALFIRAFDKTIPTNRPTAEEWAIVLRDELTK